VLPPDPPVVAEVLLVAVLETEPLDPWAPLLVPVEPDVTDPLVLLP
jgi:hypothetical protein